MEPDYGIEIYCAEGHERYLVISYVRLKDDSFPEGRDWVPSRVWLDADGRTRLARAHHVHVKHGDFDPWVADPKSRKQVFRYRFRCPRCGFDEQRKNAPERDVAFGDVLDRLAENDVPEVPVRRFIQLVWG